jgi:hypothetical protein
LEEKVKREKFVILSSTHTFTRRIKFIKPPVKKIVIFIFIVSQGVVLGWIGEKKLGCVRIVGKQASSWKT